VFVTHAARCGDFSFDFMMLWCCDVVMLW
jgi:hypothetical protein